MKPIQKRRRRDSIFSQFDELNQMICEELREKFPLSEPREPQMMPRKKTQPEEALTRTLPLQSFVSETKRTAPEEVIVLSSDEEDTVEPPRKQRKSSKQESPKKAEEKKVHETISEKVKRRRSAKIPEGFLFYEESHEDEIYTVEKIIGKRYVWGKIQYRVLWKNWNIDAATWEPLKNLTDCEKEIKEYEKERAENLLNGKRRDKKGRFLPARSV
ncbi:Oidioi.mRNA.OKI2018_I69.chr1.g1985.t1.cds [Oikopleura dioica]|uniref:Oidioi.mRNA.OKI2018_I69.chr1.g1985.t1.cds n=1 Tax=Oikopleura dioica TaxID=34765 RepID=A0ABN7SUR4_OIKDI|nr:Oidioi.mRNA.OKI2018_I69.chr1.g1985.t1.cds [Oikopleura dioica]